MSLSKTNQIKPGYFGRWGGQFIPETLMPPLLELESKWQYITQSEEFKTELGQLNKDFIGRETPLYKAENISKKLGFNIYFKREDLCHTGAHKINNSIAQVLLAKMMGKHRVMAETGAGQHGVATASAAARLGLECVVYMGEKDAARQKLNVQRMTLMGTEVRTVTAGGATLKDAMSQALREWVSCATQTHYVIGSAAGPHPYPQMVAEFQSIIGREAKQQFRALTGINLPDVLVACVGGGSNAIGLFKAFLDDESVRLVGIEAEGHPNVGNSMTLTHGQPGILHGFFSLLLQDTNGQVQPTHSISAGLDYPGVGPEHAYLKETGRAEYFAADDNAALSALQQVAKYEGIIAALETAHALAWLFTQRGKIQDHQHVIVNLSGRGDKDMETITNL